MQHQHVEERKDVDLKITRRIKKEIKKNDCRSFLFLEK